MDPDILHMDEHGRRGFDAYSARIPEHLNRTDIKCNVFFRCTVYDTPINYKKIYLSKREKDSIKHFAGILHMLY